MVDFNAERSWWIALNEFNFDSKLLRHQEEFLPKRTRWEWKDERDKRTYHHRRAYLFFSWISKGDFQWYFKVRFMKKLTIHRVMTMMMRVFLIYSMFTLYWEIFNELNAKKEKRWDIVDMGWRIHDFIRQFSNMAMK